MRRAGRVAAAALLGAALASCGGGKPPAQNPLTADLIDYRKALSMIREGRTDEAIQLLNVARDQYPDEPNIPNALGLALLIRKDSALAVKAFDTALRIDPKFWEARNNRGVAMLELGKLDEAEADFQAVLDNADTQQKVNAHLNLGILLGKRQRWADAERELSLAIADDPLNLRAYRERGNARFRREDFRPALEDFLRVLKDEPKDAVANYHAALCLLTTGRRDLAKKYMERAVSAAPDSLEGQKAKRFLESERAAATSSLAP